MFLFYAIASYLSKAADFNLPYVHLAYPIGDNPVRITRDLRHQKTMEFLGYRACGVVHVTLHLAVSDSVEHGLVTDKRTDGHTTTSLCTR